MSSADDASARPVAARVTVPPVPDDAALIEDPDEAAQPNAPHGENPELIDEGDER